MRSCASRSQPRLKPFSLRLRRHEIGRQRRPFAEEVRVHLFDQKFLGFLGAEIEPVLTGKRSGPVMEEPHRWLEMQFAERKAEPNSGLGKVSPRKRN